MKKDKLRVLVLAAIVLVLYHLVVFLIPFAKTDIFWLSYGFTLAAFLTAGLAVYIAFLRKPDAKSRFYGFPIARIGLIHVVVQLALSLLAMALGCFIPWWVALLVYALGLGAALLGLISVEAVVDQIQTQDVILKKETSLMRGLQSKLCQMAIRCEAPELKALSEEFRFSDPVSNPATAEIEADLSALVAELEGAVVDEDTEAVGSLCRQAAAMLGERNRICKLNKH